MRAAAHNMTVAHYCPDPQDLEREECRNYYRPVEVPRLVHPNEGAVCKLSELDKGLTEILSGWNFVFTVDIENKSTIPVDFLWRELSIFETDSLTTYGRNFNQARDTKQIRPIKLEKISSTSDLTDYFFGTRRH